MRSLISTSILLLVAVLPGLSRAQEGITGEAAVGDNRRGEKVAGNIEARNGHFGPYNDLLAKLKKANQDLEQARKNLEQANKNTEQANRNAQQANKDVEEAKKNVTIQTVLSLSTITAMAAQSAQLSTIVETQLLTATISGQVVTETMVLTQTLPVTETQTQIQTVMMIMPTTVVATETATATATQMSTILQTIASPQPTTFATSVLPASPTGSDPAAAVVNPNKPNGSGLQSVLYLGSLATPAA